jgi:zinc and cadmium transporter
MFFELIITLIVTSLISLIGVFTLSFNRKKLENYLDLLVALSVGALLGGAFLHLIPELAETGNLAELSIFMLGGMLLFFVLEKFVFWHHCHHSEHEHLSFSYMNLIGDTLHNFLDGVLLAGAFMLSIPIGITAALGIILHEIPQEIGDFGVLLKGGFTKKQALKMNLFVSLAAFVGAGFAILFNYFLEGIIPYLVAVAAGGFIYIAATDLIPELHKNPKISESVKQLVMILIGIIIMFAMLFLE